MTWAGVDFRYNLWTVTALRMKSKRSHRVPLSELAKEILQAPARPTFRTGIPRSKWQAAIRHVARGGSAPDEPQWNYRAWLPQQLQGLGEG
jgi:integrase